MPDDTNNIGIELDASDLFSKYGFDDGDRLRPWLESHFDREVIEGYPHTLHQDLLAVIVFKYIVPEIRTPGLQIELFHSSHNPVRVTRIDDRDWDQRKMCFLDGTAIILPEMGRTRISLKVLLEETVGLIESGGPPWESRVVTTGIDPS